MSTDLRSAKRKLERLRSLCVSESPEERNARMMREEAEAKRLAEMSPLERFAYLTTKEVNELQQKQIEYNDKIGTNPEWTTSRDAVMMRNQMNKMKMHLRTKYDKIPPPKSDEEKRQRENLRKVLGKVKNADRAPSGLRGSTLAGRSSNLYGDLDAPLTDGESPRKGVTEWDGDENNMPGAGYEPVTLDQEFQDLMTVFRENDQEIDKLLDSIQHGVMALNQQAKNISVELKTQDVLINEAEKKMDNVTSQLVGVNKKLKKTIDEVGKDKMCLYVICLLLLLALVGTILVVTKVV